MKTLQAIGVFRRLGLATKGMCLAQVTIAFLVLVFAPSRWQQLNGQSMPVGQVSDQIGRPVATMRDALRHTLVAMNVPEAEINTILKNTNTSKSHDAAASSARANLPAHSTMRDQINEVIDRVAASTAPQKCTESGAVNYDFNHWLPVRGCSNDAIQNFFKVSGSLSIADTVHYLYSPNQSTNQVGADFLTATFPQGFQTILSGIATAGSSQASTSSQNSTDSVSTAVSKLEQGGDFNVRFPYPVYYHVTSGYGVYILTSPSVGFNVSGLSGQNTITETNEYNVNVPLEFYAQTASIEKDVAVLYVDLKPAMELVSPAFASAIGLKSNRYFFLGQAAAGLEFSKRVRVGFQYFFGPQQVYQIPTGTSTTTKSSRVGGFHLVVSFSPKS